MGKKWSKQRKAQEPDRRRRARKRRENARNRQDAAAFGAALESATPLAMVRVLPNALFTGSSNIPMAILVPSQPESHIEGRTKAAGLVEHLKVALGVHALLTYHALCVLLGGGAAAKDALQQLPGGPGDIDYWLGIGRKQLSNRTGFASEEEVRQWAHHRCAVMAAIAQGAAAWRPHMIKPEVEGIRLLFRAYQRAQLTLSAFNKARKMDSEQAVAELTAAFTHAATHASCGQALQVAILADINPSELWLQHAMIYAPTFELARLVGRIDAGLNAIFEPQQFALMKQVLGSHMQNSGVEELWVILKEKIRSYFAVKTFDFAIHAAEEVDGVVRVTRATRELWIDERAGTRRYLISTA